MRRAISISVAAQHLQLELNLYSLIFYFTRVFLRIALRKSFKVEKMTKQRRSQVVTRRVAALIPSTCLSALLVFGNAVSAFGNTGGSSNKSRAKAPVSSTTEPSGGKKKEATPSPTAAAPKGDTTTDAKTQTSAVKPVFRKVGDPFVVETSGVVETADLQQSSTQTPAQRDATRPPGTEQQQTVPPTARPNPPDPRTPPGTERPAPQNPPGIQTPPASTQPPSTTAPNPAPTALPPAGTPQTSTTPGEQDTTEPNFPSVQPRPVPPLPSLIRVGVNGEDALSLTLNEAIRRALENNNEIEIARADVRLAEQQLIALRGVFDPVFTYTPELNNSIRPVTNIFGGASNNGTVSTTDFNNDATVNKQFNRGGGNFTYFFNNTREKTNASNTRINPIFSSAQGLQFTQPLWRNRSIDRNRQQIRIQRKRLEQTDADFRLRTIAIIAQVQRSYWDLVFAIRNEQNQVANVNLARENFRRTEASVAAGASAPLQRAEIETELSTRESSLLIANQQVSIAENTLKNLLIKDPLSADWSRAITPTDQPSFDETPVSLEASLKEARDNRPEMRRLKLEEDVNGINLQFYKNQTKPRIDLTGTLQTNGLAGTPQGTTTFADPNNPNNTITQPIAACTGQEAPGQGCIPKNFVGSYAQTVSNLFRLDTRQVIVGVTIQIPFKNRTAQANYAYATIQRDQLAAQTRSQEQTIEVEVRNAAQAVETSRRRVLAARAALRSAEEQLKGERRLYQVGRSTTFILFQRENALVNAQNEELQAETDYNKALADLQRATSTTLQSNNVFIDSPVQPEKFKN
jgi:HAE1 family hydrophobic/amphiphilic exporter-1